MQKQRPSRENSFAVAVEFAEDGSTHNDTIDQFISIGP